MHKLVSVLAAVFTCAVIAWVSDAFRKVGLLFYTEQFIAGLCSIVFPLIYLRIPARRRKLTFDEEAQPRTGSPPLYDIVAAVVGFVCAAYIAIRFPALSEEISTRPWDGMIAAGIGCFLFAEGLRRTVGTTITVIAVAFFLLAGFAHLLPGPLAGRQITFSRFTYALVWDSSAIFGIAMKAITTVVVAFVFFGNTLLKTGGSIFFTDISLALMGRRRGGAAKISILSSALFGTISGSAVANVMVDGVVTIPMMKKAGFPSRFAAAVEAVASTGGQLMPPVMGVAAFLIAEFLQVPYYQVALSAAIPAILYYLSLYLQADLEAARIGLKAIDSTQIPRLGHVLKDGWFFSLPIAVLFATMFWLNYEPETAALTATAVVLVAGLIFGFRGTRPRLSHLFAALRDTGFSAVELFMIGAAAGTVIASLNLSGLGFGFTFALVHIAGNNLFVLLIITAIACIILGMGMPTTGVYILLATLMAPVLVQMKVSPMAAHLFVFYYGCLSMITPPVALAAFAAANIARADPMATGYTAMRFGWTVFIIPFLFVASDTLLLRGTTGAIVVDFVLAVAGIWFGAAGVIGYSFCPVRAVARVAYCTAGLSLLIPLNAFPGARLVNVFGGCLALVLVVWEGLRRRRAIPDQNALEEGT